MAKFILLLALVLTACGGGGDSFNPEARSTAPASAAAKP